MRHVFSMMISLWLLEPFCVLGDDPTFDAPQDHSQLWRPLEVDMKLIQAALNPKPPITTHGHHVDDDMQPTTKIQQAYCRQMDVDPHVDLRASLLEVLPEHSVSIEKIFLERMDSRSSDAHLIADMLETESITEQHHLLAELAKNESQRTEVLCSRLTQVLTHESTSELCRGLVRKYRFRALAFPFVADHMGINGRQRVRIQKNHDLFTQNYATSKSKLPDAKPFVNSMRLLTLKQMETYFHHTGQLENGKPLENVLDQFPEEARRSLASVIASTQRADEAADER